ncbi:MAG: hypothetical protein B5M51_07445 [Anaerolinea sp. 4484_236]|nr:MAG: hypothetical protein B5M51_07445 [Anaerolinea sp. 4484_236]
MPSKNIGFSRTIFHSWMDATAALRIQTNDPLKIRQELDPILSNHLTGSDAKRKTIDVLIDIWHKSADVSSTLHTQALELFQNAYVSTDHLWLHYGLSLLYFSLFRQIVITIGQMSRIKDTITRNELKKRMAAEFGHLGALDRSVERISATLTDWEILPATDKLGVYRPVRNKFKTSSTEIELWLLKCILFAHPAEALPFSDLVRLPELFPFEISITLEELREHDEFNVYREGGGWDMVVLKEP